MSNAKDELAQWIDCKLIASVILEELEENDIEPTVANAQRLWLDSLEDPHRVYYIAWNEAYHKENHDSH